MKKLARTFLKAAFALLLLALLYRKADGHAFGAALRGLEWRWCVPFFAILVCNTWISAVRWGLLLRADGVRVHTGKLFASYLISSFFNFFLPSNVGGDVYRIADIANKSGRGAGSLASVFADRLCGFLALSLMGFAFPLLGLRMMPPEKRTLLLVPLVVFLGFLLLAALAMQPWLAGLAIRALPVRFRDGAGRKVDAFFESMRAYAKDRRALAGALALSLWIQLFVLLAIWCVARALALPVTLAECGVFVPFVCLLEAVPVSINGIGLRDAGYMLFFTAVGLGERGADPAASSAALSLCYMAFTLAYSCAGGLLFLNRLFRGENGRGHGPSAPGGGKSKPHPDEARAAGSETAPATILSATILSAGILASLLSAAPASGAIADSQLPGFGRDATYEISQLPTPDDLKRATARAQAVAESESAKASETDANDDPFENFIQLARTMVLARDRSLVPPSFREMSIGAMDGLLTSFDDYGAVEASDDKCDSPPAESDDNVIEGFGIMVEPTDSALEVRIVHPASPSFRAGIRAGDRIVAANGSAIADMPDFDTALAALAAESGESLVLQCEKPSDGSWEPFETRLIPEKIHYSSVPAARLMESGIGYAMIDEFRKETPEELGTALIWKFGPEAFQGMVLDLRGNPGGLLDTAAEIAANFLPAGSKVVSTRGRVPEEDDSCLTTESDGPFSNIPVAVLVDSTTGSAAEIVALALKQSGRATVIGEKTFGKGVVQDSFSFIGNEGISIKLTIAEWFPPDGESINGKGIAPDVRINQNDDTAWRVHRLNMLECNPETARPEELAALRAQGSDAMLDAAVADILGRIAAAAAENARESVAVNATETKGADGQ